jgi:hypothetical protein
LLLAVNPPRSSTGLRRVTRRLGFMSPAAAVIVLLLTFMQLARAGGPAYIAGISYFNQGTAGTPLTWAHGVVNYYTDQGSLSPTVSGPQGDALVADAFSQWTSISTAALSVTHAGQLAENVSDANVYRNPDGTITMPADIMPTATGTPVGIVYDVDRTVTDSLLGQGAGDASECFGNAVFGGLDNFGTDAYLVRPSKDWNSTLGSDADHSGDVAGLRDLRRERPCQHPAIHWRISGCLGDSGHSHHGRGWTCDYAISVAIAVADDELRRANRKNFRPPRKFA